MTQHDNKSKCFVTFLPVQNGITQLLVIDEERHPIICAEDDIRSHASVCCFQVVKFPQMLRFWPTAGIFNDFDDISIWHPLQFARM